MTAKRILKDVNEVRRPKGRPRTKVGETLWEKLHVALGNILKDMRFGPDHRERVHLSYKGRLLDLKKQVILLHNILEAYSDDELKKESRYDELFK